MERKKRQGITDLQRHALRQWFKAQYPRPGLQRAVEWFAEQFQHRLAKSSASEILSAKFAHLDAGVIPQNGLNQRSREPEWRTLETVLFNWYQLVDNQGGIVTGDILKAKALEFWKRLPEYSSLPPPKFSNGWLTGFKRRHSLRKITRHGEPESVPERAFEEMKDIRLLAGEYEEQDVYNMDETGLFWRQSPSAGLSTGPRASVQVNKSRITLALCCNADGSDRLPILFIGRSKWPRPLQRVNFTALGAQWRGNAKASMTGPLMQEWLQSFYSHVGQRKVLLLMDNFSSHVKGVEDSPPPSNVRIQWLPANSTSKFQPLHQGIIYHTKTYYRKQWIQFLIDKFEHKQDPYKEISIYHAVQWAVRAWQHDVTNTTIANCFRKSTVLEQQNPLRHLPIVVPNVQELWRQVQRVGNIRDAMSLDNFLNPRDEDIQELPADPVERGIQAVMPFDEEEAEDLGPPPPPPPKPQEALYHLQQLLAYMLTLDTTSPIDIHHLVRMERQLKSVIEQSRQQTTLDSWIM